MITLLVDRPSFEASEVTVGGAKYRHLFRARRLQVDDRLRLVDGCGRARFGEVMRVERELAVLRLGEAAPSNEPTLELELLVGGLRPERASWLVEKGTEIGIAAFRFFHSQHSPRTYGEGTLSRLRRVAEAAVEQCGRSRVPELVGMLELVDLTERITDTPSIVLDPAAPRSRPLPGDAAALVLVVGPEGGFSAAERAQLDAAGCRPLGLGERVLRIETAAVIGSALFLCGAE